MTFWVVEVKDGRTVYRFKKESMDDAWATYSEAIRHGFEARAWKVRKVTKP